MPVFLKKTNSLSLSLFVCVCMYPSACGVCVRVCMRARAHACIYPGIVTVCVYALGVT
jgi:hypothetical protein